MFKKYSSNQHVDFDFVYPFASMTSMCKERRWDIFSSHVGDEMYPS
jgi:hypothetical protein